MNETRLNALITLLIGIETAIIISSYWESIGSIAICIGGIYLLTALSDFWTQNNVRITRLLLVLSLLITIPRLILQTEEVIGKEKEKELLGILSIPKPIRREIKTEIFDCSRIPHWQGELQMNCNLSNMEQKKLENQAEETYLLAFREYEMEIQQRKEALNTSNIRFLNLRSISILLLYLLITPIIPLLNLFLVHGDGKYFREVMFLEDDSDKEIDVQEANKNRKTIAKKLLISGFKMEEIQCEVGVSRATLYRWRKELEYTGI